MEKFQGKKILVTGGAGFIGFHLTKKLLELGNDVTIYDNLSSGLLKNVDDVPEAKFIKGDILDLTKLFSLPAYDIIYHLAAQVVVPYSMENPIDDFDTNAKGTVNVLEKARKDNSRFIFASSAAVYGNPAVFPTPEDYGFQPFSCYGLSKVVGEQYSQMYLKQYGLEITILRFANVFGHRCHGVINDFLDKLQRNPYKLEIIGTGQQSRDFIHVSDVVEALILSVNKNTVGETYNLGFGATTKIIDLANLILNILNLSQKTLVTTTNISWQGDVTTIWFDITKAKKELNWQPYVKLENHLKDLLKERNMI